MENQPDTGSVAFVDTLNEIMWRSALTTLRAKREAGEPVVISRDGKVVELWGEEIDDLIADHLANPPRRAA